MFKKWPGPPRRPDWATIALLLVIVFASYIAFDG